jgi:hypothetical protein
VVVVVEVVRAPWVATAVVVLVRLVAVMQLHRHQLLIQHKRAVQILAAAVVALHTVVQVARLMAAVEL